MQKITTFLMYDGQTEEAMNFYISIFKDSDLYFAHYTELQIWPVEMEMD